MKRFSKTLLCVLLAGLIAFTAIGCSTTVEEIAPAVVPAPAPEEAPAPAPAPAPVPAPEPEAEPEAEPVVEEAKIEYPLGVEPIVKNAQGDEDFDLFIVHTSDVLGKESADDASIGYGVLSTLVKTGRAITDNILVLDSGNVLSGSTFASLTEGEAAGELLSLAGYDAVAPSSADFAYGIDRLEALSELAEENSLVRVISANVTDKNGYLRFQPYQVYDFNGFIVAVIGLTTPDIEGIEGIEFMHPLVIDGAQKAIDMAHEYADYVIVLGDTADSLKLPTDLILSSVKGIDLYIDGSNETEAETVGSTTLVSAGEGMSTIGLVQLHVKDGKVTATFPMQITKSDVANIAESALFDEFGPVLDSFGVSFEGSIPEDSRVASYIADVRSELGLDRAVAEVPSLLDGDRDDVCTKKTNLSKLVCQAMTEASGSDLTLINGGLFSGSISKGIVTLGDIYGVLPYDANLIVCELTGQQVLDALEYGFSSLPEASGKYAQTDLQVIYNTKSPVGSRIKRARLDGVDIDPAGTYTVATCDRLNQGGDGYTMFSNTLRVGRAISDIFADYLAATFPIMK